MIVLATAGAETALADSLIERWATSADMAHAASRRSPAARHVSLLARAGIRALLFGQTAQNEWVLRADRRGKLSAIDAKGHAGPALCVAHTRGRIACALGDNSGDVRAIGVDIEAHRPRNFSAIAKWSFGPQECAAVAAGDVATFYRIWTLREALGKATGEGLALATDRRDRAADGPDSGTWRKRIGQQDWLLGHFRPTQTISLAFAGWLKDGNSADASAVQWLDLGAM